MSFKFIYATTKDGIFSINNKLPWKHQPEDLQMFKKLTLNSSIVMGRKTLMSLPNEQPLPNRKNYVVSSKLKCCENYSVISFDDIQSLIESEKNLWIIGGKLIFESLLNLKIYPSVVVASEILDGVSDEFNDDDVKVFFKPDLSFMQCTQQFKLTDRINVTVYNKSDVDAFAPFEREYLRIGSKIFNQPSRQTRNSLVRSLFDETETSLVVDFKQGFPILSSKRVWFKGVIGEFNFFLSGETDTTVLSNQGIKIWEGNTNKQFLMDTGKSNTLKPGEMGPMYGFQLRHFGEAYKGSSHKYGGIDQIENVISLILTDPCSRRILLTTYNPSQAEEGVLYPCHGLITQFYVCTEKNTISLKTYQRSADWFLGVPFNISSYALLLMHIISEVNTRGQQTYSPGKMSLVFGDVHIYETHRLSFLEQYVGSVFPQSKKFAPEYDEETGEISNYHPIKTIKADMVC